MVWVVQWTNEPVHPRYIAQLCYARYVMPLTVPFRTPPPPPLAPLFGTSRRDLVIGGITQFPSPPNVSGPDACAAVTGRSTPVTRDLTRAKPSLDEFICGS